MPGSCNAESSAECTPYKGHGYVILQVSLVGGRYGVLVVVIHSLEIAAHTER